MLLFAIRLVLQEQAKSSAFQRRNFDGAARLVMEDASVVKSCLKKLLNSMHFRLESVLWMAA